VTDVASVGGADLRWAAASDVGRTRSLNEDSVLVAPPVFAVADGMGGHEAGEIASALVVERLRGLASGAPASIESVVAEIRHVNSLLVEAGGGGSRSMGTTATVLVVVDNGGTTSWLVGNVGDSRAYCWRRDRLNQITRDHSFVQDLLDAGAVDAAEARRHPQRNLVTRALGLSEDVEADYWVRPVRPGERFLLCSDGLTGELTDEQIEAEMARRDPPADTVERLVRMAVEAGGRDNVTAVVVDVQGTPAPSAAVDDDGVDDDLSITTGRRPFRRVDVPPPQPPDDLLIADVPQLDRAEVSPVPGDPADPITDVPLGPAPERAAEGPPPAPDLIDSLPSDLVTDVAPDPSTEGRK
jgi:protein phosphatase